MDPLSATTGALALFEVTVKLVKFLKEVRDGYAKTDRTLGELIDQLTTLRNAAKLVSTSIDGELIRRDSAYKTAVGHLELSLSLCQTRIRDIDRMVKEVIGDPKKERTLPGLQRYLRMANKEKDFADVRVKLFDNQSILQQHMTSLLHLEAQAHHRDSMQLSKDQHAEISQSLASMSARLRGLEYVHAPLSPTLLNEHFYLPKGVSSIYVGRTKDLQRLSDWIFSESSIMAGMQKRVVIYGLPGSGKTEFCCKFASEHKARFWGVFYVDASSSERMKQDFAKIASYGKVDPNERAAKNWLSTRGSKKPWLLFIDNADDEDFPIEECYPDSADGCVLITTRNPRLRTQGTAGGKHLEFSGLDKETSVDLLLTAAGKSRPWTESTVSTAREIAKTLGYLPLALSHAGTTILERSLSLDDYPRFFEDSWKVIQQTSHAKAVINTHMTIYSSYELIHQGLKEKGTQATEDALDLLRITSFLHNLRVRRDLFLRAASGPLQENEERERTDREENALATRFPRPTRPLRLRARASIVQVFSRLTDAWNQPVLPSLLSNGSVDQDRLGEALRELTKWSLISLSRDRNGASFSIHPAVHLWLRKRSQQHVASQAMWCHVAATILARAILLPPLGNSEDDEEFRRDILPHINCVREHELEINETLRRNQDARSPRLPFRPAMLPLNKERATSMIKFSVVYEQCGMLREAAELQETVLQYVRPRLGPQHETTVNVMLLLSRVYWKMTYSHKAATLQKEALDICIQTFGEQHPRTMMMMDAYGSSLWLQGRPLDSMEWHKKAYEQLRQVRGESHIDTLRALGNMGRVVTRDWRWEDAISIHKQVVEGLEADKKIGPTHLDTLEAKDNLAMAYFDRTAFGFGVEGDLDHALELEKFAFEHRNEKLGREHIMTLWSGLNLARILGLRGQIDEALSVFYEGHNIALRNLGENHFGTLWGKTHLGRILTYAKRYEEAEKVLQEVVDTIKTTQNAPIEERRAHPDRLLALFSLIKCRTLMGKDDAETRTYLEELKDGVRETFGEEHPSYQYLLNPKNMLVVRGPGDSDRRDSQVSFPGEPENESQFMLARYGHISVNDEASLNGSGW